MKPFMILMLSVFMILSCENISKWQLSSPDNRITCEIALRAFPDDAVYPTQKRLYYRIKFQQPKSVKAVLLDWSPLGISRDDQDFLDDLKFVSMSPVSQVEQNYDLPHGKRSNYKYQTSEMTLTFENANGAKLEIIFRASNDGAAFRYRFPERDQTLHSVTKEWTGFRIASDGLAFMQPHDEAGQYTPAYEAISHSKIAIGTPSPHEAGWSFPALFSIQKDTFWLLLTEAGLDRTYFGARLEKDVTHKTYQIRMPDETEGNGTGSVQPRSALPWMTPWRVIMVGESLAAIIESSLVAHLSLHALFTDTDWVKPGRVSWSWWSDSDSPRDPEKLKSFVDLAAEMSWEYSLVDANWNLMPRNTIPDLVQYAAKKNVGILLWYNSGGPHNIVTEAPRDRMFHREIRRKEFQWLRQIGVKGVKVDFFQSDKQDVISLYQDILQDAADFQIMVNFHGCTLPRGWSRTYPHLMTMEAVQGAENYKFNADYPEVSPWQNVHLAFTRNVVGSMDYTPVTFSNSTYPRKTTYGHELALSVIYESGWLHFADDVKTYLSLAEPVKDFLRRVPVAWDDIRFVSGYPAEHVVLARRKGADWYVAGINGTETGKTIDLFPGFLENASYHGRLITDGAAKDTFVVRDMEITRDALLKLEMQKFGGFVLHLKAKK